MATVVDGDAFSKPRATFYPWDQWSDGRVWAAKRGEDFTVDTFSFRQALYAQARRMPAHRVRTTVDGDTVTFQFTAMDDE